MMRRTPFLKRTLDQSQPPTRQPTRSWQLLAYLSNPESLQGEARRLVEAEAKRHRTRNAALADAAVRPAALDFAKEISNNFRFLSLLSTSSSSVVTLVALFGAADVCSSFLSTLSCGGVGIALQDVG